MGSIWARDGLLLGVQPSDPKPAILFTAFEPSGDDHASAIIRVLKEWYPDLKIFGWGGRHMRDAGADIIEHTGDDAVMGVPGLQKIQEHRQINAKIEHWLKDNPIAVHVPVDSPAANFPVCKLTKPQGAKVVHMVAPQLWAWAPWRIRKLRRLTNHVMCVLPFEPGWFTPRGVQATFVGHQLFDQPLDLDALDEQIKDWRTGPQQIALMPGSRPGEMRKNFPLLLGAYIKLAAEHPDMVGMVAATRKEIEPELSKIAKDAGLDWPDSLSITHAQTDAVIRWCSFALVVSGTVTLQIARQHKPMVIVYKSSRLIWSLAARWFIRTKFFTLPNIVAGREIVPELVPHFAGAEPIADRAVQFLENPEAYQEQVDNLKALTAQFSGHHASQNAAALIAKFAGLEPIEQSQSDQSQPDRDQTNPAPGVARAVRDPE
ncbi:MAG: lipid-A-disaccharide synthase [Phycisphaerales bacterium]|nr:lipid-A-disaccharide synthase [Phycisphaerales bacterium]